ncbi:hypothetical protein SAMN05192557_1210 [Aliicoccus persicus]|uniref:Uncharacterized protein n=1 Tax=Aliicoccus persicus TaxID=930138 RepID=A0A662Z5E5_9STAP|nr:hypothetical protein SAMN05192557_1210 [Aliicoccus persicus]
MEYLMIFGAMAIILIASMGVGTILESFEARKKTN